MDANHLERIRLLELERVTSYFEPGCKILEIGAGAGWQAKQLARMGFDVVAVDLPSSEYVSMREYPVIDFDGRRIPFKDRVFDVVFTSNVLEHVRDLDALQREIQRVMKPTAQAVHILPTPAWRLWTTIVHYPSYFRRVLRIVEARRVPSPAASSGSPGSNVPAWSRVASILAIRRHGERGNLVTEAYYFSRLFWSTAFRRAGWSDVSAVPVGLFYTGYSLLGSRLSIPARTRLGRVLGSACRVYRMRLGHGPTRGDEWIQHGPQPRERVCN